MHRLTLLIALLVLTACGSDDGSKAPAAAVTAPTAEPTTTDAPSPVVESEAAPLQSLALSTLADMPACDAARQSQLIYVIEVKVFYTCDAARWIEIAVVGADGKNGVDGKDGAPIPSNTWIDPFTGRAWLIGGVGPRACAGKTRLPTTTEAFEAVENGIASALTATSFWTVDSVITTAHAFTAPSTNHGIACIKE